MADTPRPMVPPVPEARLPLNAKEAAAEALLAEYLAHVASLGVQADDAARLQSLTANTAMRVAEREGPREIPGRGLFNLTPNERAELLAETREFYADLDGPRDHPTRQNRLKALYDKTRLTPEQRAEERAEHGWEKVPTLTEWLDARGITDERVRVYLAARLRGDWTDSLRSTGSSSATADAYLFYGPKQLEELFRLTDELTAERAKRETAERDLVEERRKREEAERRERRTAGKLTGLADRVVMPGHLIESGYKRTPFAAVLERVQQGEIFAGPDTRLNLQRGVELVASHSQLGRLPAEQVRAMFAVFRLFSTEGDDGCEFADGPFLASARRTYWAAGLTSSRDNTRRRLFDALRAVSSQELAVALLGEKKDGGKYVVGARTPMFTMRPVWIGSRDKRRQLTDADAARVAEEWAAHGTDGTAWTGPLPDEYEFSLPPIMRKVWNRLVLNADVLDRLNAGAKSARGASESFHGLDWRLFVEVTQTVQTGQRSEDGSRFRSFVDRKAVLEDFYRADKIAAARKAGKYKARYESQYDKAAEVLEAADIARLVVRDHTTTQGRLRDVFELSPDVIKGTKKRLKRVAGKGRKKGRGGARHVLPSDSDAGAEASA